MENTLEAVSASSDAPIKVEVVNVDEFHEDLIKKVIAGVAVTTAIGLTKLAFDIIKEKRAERKAEKANKEVKPELKTVKE